MTWHSTPRERQNWKRGERIADEVTREYGADGGALDFRRALTIAAARALNSEDAIRDRISGEAARREAELYRRDAMREDAS